MTVFKGLKYQIGALVLAASTAIFAAPGQIADQPLYMGGVADPNLLFILDDSGSMAWAYMPDEIKGSMTRNSCTEISQSGDNYFYSCSENNRRYLFSSKLNFIYFNPDERYPAPPGKSDASYTSAWVDGYDQSSGTLDLSSQFRVQFHRDDYTNGRRDHFFVGTAQEAFYYNANQSCTDDRADSCYSTKVRIPADMRQKFANWFSYYRTRMMAAKAGIGAAFDGQSSDIRVGYGTINANNTIVRGVEAFEGASRQGFFNWLYGAEADGTTPLKSSLEDAGDYYLRTDNNGPWASAPGSTDPHLECRLSSTILMTDGYYSTENTGFGNVDNTQGPLIDGVRHYQPVAPFADSRSDTLADIAMEYWVNDLRPDLDNKVRPKSDINTASWQHMITYGVGFGVTGSIDAVDAFDAIKSGSSVSWADPSTSEGKIDDLLHAAVNSRGGFFNASKPSDFAEKLGELLGEFNAISGGSSSLTFNTSTLETDTLLFGAGFSSQFWSGELFARQLIVSADGTPSVATGNAWEAGEMLKARNLATDPRQIITYSGGQSTPFAWANLDALQKSDLAFGGDDALGQQRLDYVRGEAVSGMRNRDGNRLGDIVHSTPVYVQKPSQNIPNSGPFGVAGNRYANFKASKESRRPVVYFGANDGMLHAVAADSTAATGGGKELFAYLPNFVFSDQAASGLHYQTNPSYQHRYYNDLSPAVADVYSLGATGATRDWRTILIGGGRTGERGIYALDITDPSAISEATANRLALWEFTSDNDSRLGYITEPPLITLARWGNDYRWSAIFGNGYNSLTPATGIFILDIEGGIGGNWSEQTGQTGQGNYRFISFDSGLDATGLSPIRGVDLSGARIVERVYGGDLKGNLWVASNSSGRWENPYGGELFRASPGGTGQAITAAPMVISNPTTPAGSSPDLMVLFGTGQYLTDADPTDLSTQSFYGVFEQGQSGLRRSDLRPRSLQETSITTADGKSYDVRYSNGDAVAELNGWYVDFTTEPGERIIQSPQVRGDYIFINSNVPSVDFCDGGGGGGWLMAFGLDGRTPDRAVFKRFDNPVVGYRTDGGLPNTPGFLGDFMITTRSDGEIIIDEVDVGDDDEGLGRLSWQELYD